MLALCTIAFAAPAVMAAPVVDGNLADFITFGQQLEANNTGFGVAITDKPDVGGNAHRRDDLLGLRSSFRARQSAACRRRSARTG